MKKNYFLLLILSSFFAFSQVTPITSSLTADLTGYAGATEFAGQGEYEVFLGNDNILDKPIILIDGFDPGDSRPINGFTDMGGSYVPGIYDLLNFNDGSGTSNLADDIRAMGYDVVILNFPVYTNPTDSNLMVDGGADFIERNALILVELIQQINTDKAANNPEQNVIIGPSMGGLISRYALNYMENNMFDADTRLWISFDSPHLGANVPIGLQHQFNYLAFNSTAPTAEVQPIIDDVLNSPAARQLLIDHFEPHLDTVINDGVTFDNTLTLPIPHPYRTQFETNINSLDGDASSIDFPANVRKVAITNGSGEGTAYKAKDGITDVTPGFTIVDTTLPVQVGIFTVNVDIDINMTPVKGSAQQVSRFFTTVVLTTIESIANSGTTNFDGVDAAPGGLFDLSGLSGDVPMDGIAGDFLDALTIDKFSFIPTVSALALEITDEGNNADNVDWFHDIDIASTRATTNNTPFDNTYLAILNEDHVELNSGNVTFVLDEILNATFSSNDFDETTFKVERNPIRDEIILSSNTPQDASIKVIDFSGKTVFNTKTVLNNRTSIPVQLNSGFYILRIDGEDNTQFITKFIVE
ncbi:MAG: T9SS C-terminal target domain-containing protein [Winogradskyella sp.]|uniref:T9SS type A sorting domain-containing protein n=1 Tax=Winogradskyella sp. TaxID=1883156 RepID=UPI000F3B8B58|nr:T9SS type A sorting domain-containing protein [Winogradskyella sp.]RNC84073.1 MAG: T9SS C-terminal target domain-containing protein [Winogradskyella sp.]